ncbi:hypothetical protein HDU97_007898 [Phlyctochytrium planicorne]|nr:hypothetical protein HDU97_007898 [Phlyctochytrium planicorne]
MAERAPGANTHDHHRVINQTDPRNESHFTHQGREFGSTAEGGPSRSTSSSSRNFPAHQRAASKSPQTAAPNEVESLPRQQSGIPGADETITVEVPDAAASDQPPVKRKRGRPKGSIKIHRDSEGNPLPPRPKKESRSRGSGSKRLGNLSDDDDDDVLLDVATTDRRRPAVDTLRRTLKVFQKSKTELSALRKDPDIGSRLEQLSNLFDGSQAALEEMKAVWLDFLMEVGPKEDLVMAWRERKKRKASLQKCTSCQSSDTPEWRRGPAGPRTLCNACGLIYAKIKNLNREEQEESQHSQPIEPAENFHAFRGSNDTLQSSHFGSNTSITTKSSTTAQSDMNSDLLTPLLESQQHLPDTSFYCGRDREFEVRAGTMEQASGPSQSGERGPQVRMGSRPQERSEIRISLTQQSAVMSDPSPVSEGDGRG